MIRSNQNRRRLGAVFFTGALLIGAGGPAAAADFSVYPTRIDIERAGRAAAVTVANLDTRPLHMQVRLA